MGCPSKNWKECVWRSEDGRDYGPIKVADSFSITKAGVDSARSV